MNNNLINTTLLLSTYDILRKKRPLELSKDAEKFIEEESNSINIVDSLAEEGLTSDAIKVLAHALSKPRSVWWAIQVCRASFPEGEEPPKDDQKSAESCGKVGQGA